MSALEGRWQAAAAFLSDLRRSNVRPGTQLGLLFVSKSVSTAHRCFVFAEGADCFCEDGRFRAPGSPSLHECLADVTELAPSVIMNGGCSQQLTASEQDNPLPLV